MKFALAIVASVASAVKLHAEAQEDMTLILEDNGTWYQTWNDDAWTEEWDEEWDDEWYWGDDDYYWEDDSGLCYDCWYGDEVWDLAVELTNHLFEMDWDGDNVVEHKELEGSM